MSRRRQPLLLGVLVTLPFLLWSCGGSESADQAKLEQARRQGVAAAHHADQIRQLQKEVAALKRGQAAPEAAGPNAQSEVSTEAVDSRIPASGSYGGEAQQRGTPTRINKNYPMQMSFSSGGSQVMYPTLSCEGVLQPLGFQGESRVYEEKITSGHCDSGGTWLVHVDGLTTIEAAWSLPSASYTVSATLVAE